MTNKAQRIRRGITLSIVIEEYVSGSPDIMRVDYPHRHNQHVHSVQ
jgi:hypothetical protein